MSNAVTIDTVLEKAQRDLTDLIKIVRDEFVRDGMADSYYQINNGQCEEFMLEVCSRYPSKEYLMEAYTEFFLGDGDEGFDWEWLSQMGIDAPEGLTREETEGAHFGGHAFIILDKRWYDAEAPDGAESIFELPIFRRSIITALRKKGISTPDVVTDDVKPAPLCKIPNPVAKADPSPGL
ncbi:hypothetical protein [Pseudomonas putida]|uniref:Uncharacterized protein n=1 Tax=Pseudomonas putida TaxID=303 RepID=A0A8I1JJH9_PSEPU|nr:hypothetical protein [Pseudomonas putida]MBI6882385.1 hypothetical protein [Pseudomonas putida]